MNIELTKQEVEAVMQCLAVMPYNQVAELIAFFNGKLTAPKPTELPKEEPKEAKKEEVTK